MFRSKGVTYFTFVIVLMALSCSGPESDQPVLTAELPLHLEEHIDDTKILGSKVSEDLPTPVEWQFDKLQPNWRPVSPLQPSFKPIHMTYTDDALRISLSGINRYPGRQFMLGGLYTDLPEWHQVLWDTILVSARTKDDILALQLAFNLRKRLGPTPPEQSPYLFFSDGCEVIEDGSVHNYMLRVNRYREKFDDTLKQLCIMVVARKPANFDILSVKAIPKEALYSDVPVGLSTDVRSDAYHRTLFSHTPGKLEYRIKVPKAGQLDVGLGVLRGDIPVTFRITAISKGGKEESLLEKVYSDSEHWGQYSVDLSRFAGQIITLRLESEAERAGTVSLWAAPTISGKRTTKKPNVILYIIDGASADYMSVYGYNRRTTPNLERLAAEGAVFEHAYSNATWTKVSNPSFMTSLYNSVLGGYTSETGQFPDKAITMAQLMHNAGYQTGVFTTNPYCGTMSGFNRGVDWLREKGVENKIASSRDLHLDFWEWRKAYPGEPYWVHFQTTDVHWPWKPEAPFAGLYLSSEMRMRYYEWEHQVAKAAGWSNPTWPSPKRLPPDAFKKAGINHLEFFEAARCLNDEAMAHNDYQIGKLVERLKNSGEWENTLLIIAADHGSFFGLGLYDTIPPIWGPRFRSYETRIPMIFVWPEHIAPGLRLRQPVSMIDMLPTILDLAGLPAPELMQGQSLAPLLLGKEGWDPRPVIFDEFYVDRETGHLMGRIEVIDGRWGASLNIGPKPRDLPLYRLGPAPPFSLLLYDVWEDPNCLVPLNEKRPDLVKKYTEFLEEKWKEHQELAKRFSRSEDTPLTPEQLRTLRSLGYIR